MTMSHPVAEQHGKERPFEKFIIAIQQSKSVGGAYHCSTRAVGENISILISSVYARVNTLNICRLDRSWPVNRRKSLTASG